MGKGRSQATLEAFFDEIGEENAQRIEAITVDMWDPYPGAIQVKSPQARIAFEKFHIARHYLMVIDRARNDEVRKAEDEGKSIQRGTKCLLLKNWENLSERQQSRPNTFLALNSNFSVVYVLKEDLKRLCECKDREEAPQILVKGTQAAEESGIKALTDFARMHFWGCLIIASIPSAVHH